MYNIGDNILYGMSGVMTVLDVRQEKILGEEKTYYVLCEQGGKSTSLTYVPVENDKLTASMHPLLTASEAREAVSAARSCPDLDWMEDSRARAEYYRGVLRSADRCRILVMIRTIHNTGLRRAEMGKKNFLTDENIMRKAEGLIAREFSISLGITQDQVHEIIRDDVKGERGV